MTSIMSTLSSVSLDVVCLAFIPGYIVHQEIPYPCRVNSNEYDIQEENEIVQAVCCVRIILVVGFQALFPQGEMYFGCTPLVLTPGRSESWSRSVRYL